MAASNNFLFDNPIVSRVHAEISMECGMLYITDMGSTHGTEFGGHGFKYSLPSGTRTLLTNHCTLSLGSDITSCGRKYFLSFLMAQACANDLRSL